MLPVLLAACVLFALLFVARLGGARRPLLMVRWPAFAFGLAAAWSLFRGAWASAALLGAFAAYFWRAPARPRAAPSATKAEAEARAILGVSASATAAEIRRAYRELITRHHPDRGGDHAYAARLTAARDLLLGKRR